MHQRRKAPLGHICVKLASATREARCQQWKEIGNLLNLLKVPDLCIHLLWRDWKLGKENEDLFGKLMVGLQQFRDPAKAPLTPF